MEKKTYIIKQDIEGVRLDKAISENDSKLSRSMVQKMLENGNILVNGKPAKASYKVAVGDKIEVTYDEPKEVDLKPEDIPLDVVYEDSDILIVNKQKGIVVHPGNGNPDGTLVNAIMAKCKDSLSGN